jgi:hypothetical protein
MADAPLQAAPSPLSVGEIYHAFIALCVDTEGAFEAACATAAVSGFEQFDLEAPIPGGVVRQVAEARFRKPGYFFTTSKLLAEPPGRPSRRILNASLVARPASYRDLLAALAADLRTPTSTNATPGVAYVFLGDPRDTPALKSREDGDRRFANGEGDLVVISAWEVREDATQPSDAVALAYQRWSSSGGA